MNKNYVILPGANRTPYHYWYAWLFGKIYEHTTNVKIINFPTMEKLNYKNWEKLFKAYVKLGIINANSVVIAHSTASIFVARYLIKHKLKVDSLITVSGFNSLNFKKIDDEDVAKIIYSSNQTFIKPNLKLEKINKYARLVTCFVSESDPIIPFDELTNFANKLNGKTINIKKGGHFNDKSGYIEFNELLSELEEDF